MTATCHENPVQFTKSKIGIIVNNRLTWKENSNKRCDVRKKRMHFITSGNIRAKGTSDDESQRVRGLCGAIVAYAP